MSKEASPLALFLRFRMCRCVSYNKGARERDRMLGEGRALEEAARISKLLQKRGFRYKRFSWFVVASFG